MTESGGNPTPRKAGMGERIQGRRGVELRRRRLADEPLCRDCKAKGRVRAADVVDHIKPLCQGGEDEDANCRPLCVDCHLARTAEQFGTRPPKPRIGLDGWPVG